MNRPASFRQIDITRALRAAKAAGYVNARVEVAVDGKLVLMVGQGLAFPKSANSNPWDEELAQ